MSPGLLSFRVIWLSHTPSLGPATLRCGTLEGICYSFVIAISLSWCHLLVNDSFFGMRWLLRKFNICPNAHYNFLKNRKSAYRAQKQRVLKEERLLMKRTILITNKFPSMDLSQYLTANSILLPICCRTYAILPLE